MKLVSFFYPSNASVGLGHQRRCQAIADYLAKNKLAKVQFNNIVTNTSVVVFDHPSHQNISKRISNIHHPTSSIKIIVIDNISPARLLADVNIYPIAHFSPNTLDWKGYKGKIYSGAKYFPLNQEFLKFPRAKRMFNTHDRRIKKSILITFGGSDFRNLTPKIIKALLSIPNIEIHALIGPFFKKQSFNWPNNVFIHQNPLNSQNSLNIASLMVKSTMAITAFGITCYELAYLGIPTLIIYNFKRDKENALNFQKFGNVQVVGYYQNITNLMVEQAVKKLLTNPQKLKQMSKAGKKLVDGKGVKRIARIILSL